MLNSIELKIKENPEIFDAGIYISSGKDDFSYEFYKGDLTISSQFAIASITKLFTAAVIFKMIDENLLSLNDKLVDFLDKEMLDNLLKGKAFDASYSITIYQLLSQTSGFPDYFSEKAEDGKSYLNMILENDFSFSYEDIVKRTKELKPHELKSDQAYYSDFNFDSLGVIAEKLSGLSLEDLYDKYIFKVLNLKSTALYKADTKVLPIYKNKEQFYKPLSRSSLNSSGGLYSNIYEIMIFIKAFWNGDLFSKKHLENQTFRKFQWFPTEYGLGMMRRMKPEIFGHTGAVGSFAFYCPTKDLFIVGTFNQIKVDPFPIISEYLQKLP